MYLQEKSTQGKNRANVTICRLCVFIFKEKYKYFKLKKEVQKWTINSK